MENPGEVLVRSAEQALAFIERYGIVLESASGPVPSLSQNIVGRKIQGSWWSHPMSKDIFRLTRAVRASPDVLVCRLISGKVTFVHQRLWPALIRTAARFRPDQLARVADKHTSAGKHESSEIAFPAWVPPDVVAQARTLSETEALNILEAAGYSAPSSNSAIS
jgi:hypothetical protein